VIENFRRLKQKVGIFTWIKNIFNPKINHGGFDMVGSARDFESFHSVRINIFLSFTCEQKCGNVIVLHFTIYIEPYFIVNSKNLTSPHIFIPHHSS